MDHIVECDEDDKMYQLLTTDNQNVAYLRRNKN